MLLPVALVSLSWELALLDEVFSLWSSYDVLRESSGSQKAEDPYDDKQTSSVSERSDDMSDSPLDPVSLCGGTLGEVDLFALFLN